MKPGNRRTRTAAVSPASPELKKGRGAARAADSINDIARAFKTGGSFFLAGHQNPDGDTLGCVLALSSILKRMGKSSYVFSPDPVPENLKFLPGSGTIRVNKLPGGNFDSVILLECSTPGRAGNLGNLFDRAGCVINIDHHPTAEPYGDVNLIDAASSSTAELLYRVIDRMKLKLTPEEATCLYVGIATDTGRFMYPVTSFKTHLTAAALLESGARAAEANDRIYSTKPLPALKLLGRALEHLEIIHSGKCALSYLTFSDLKWARALPQHTEDIVNYGMMVPGVKASALFREEENRVAVNFRSRGELNVGLLAKKFGGGGHKNAAGCKMKKPLGEVMEQVKAALCSVFNGKKD